jgi:hypothetical protein
MNGIYGLNNIKCSNFIGLSWKVFLMNLGLIGNYACNLLLDGWEKTSVTNKEWQGKFSKLLAIRNSEYSL